MVVWSCDPSTQKMESGQPELKPGIMGDPLSKRPKQNQERDISNRKNVFLFCFLPPPSSVCTQTWRISCLSSLGDGTTGMLHSVQYSISYWPLPTCLACSKSALPSLHTLASWEDKVKQLITNSELVSGKSRTELPYMWYMGGWTHTHTHTSIITN